MPELRYEESQPQSQQELVEALASPIPERMRAALYGAPTYESDWGCTQKQCLKFLDHPLQCVRWAGALLLGLFAVSQRTLDRTKVLPKPLVARQHKDISSAVEDSPKTMHQYSKTG